LENNATHFVRSITSEEVRISLVSRKTKAIKNIVFESCDLDYWRWAQPW